MYVIVIRQRVHVGCTVIRTTGESTLIEVGSEVREALDAGRPVVALESTVIAHGLPAPRNLKVARALEAAVRAEGAVPATVAIVDGVARVGLTESEMERIAGGEGVAKVSTREIPVVAARRGDGATTVAATMWLAARTGVAVFATGGIGGVHRGAPRDVSADLVELGRTAMIVVCAGAKSVLDLPETREALEAAGVLVAGWRTDEMPAFYSRESGLSVDVRVDGAEEMAAVWAEARAMDAPGAVLLCVPPPTDVAVPAVEIEGFIRAALEEAGRAGVAGKAVTPYLLAAVARATGGRSLETNVGLLMENARVAGRVASAIASG